MEENVREYKMILENRISEWLGFDIPHEDDEDYVRWQDMTVAVAGIVTVDDALEVAEMYFGDPENIFETLTKERGE